MYFQRRYLQENRAFSGLTGLDTIDLPNKGLLSGIEFRVWGSNGNDATKPDVWLHDRISKIELVVNGSQVVKSLTGEQLLADMLYKKTPHLGHDMKNMNAGSCEEFFYINLGRFYHDMDYMLDLSQVNDPELRITFNFQMTGHHGWTNGVAMTVIPSRNVICHLLRDSDIVPKGYIKTSEVYRFTSGVAKQENMTIARGPMYSNLYLQWLYNGEGFGNGLDHVEINLNSDDVIPMRIGVTELEAELVRSYGLFHMAQQVTWTDAQAYPHPLESGRVWGPVAAGLDAEIAGCDLWNNAIPAALRLTSTGGAHGGQCPVRAEYKGVFPFSIAAIPHFDPMDERTWIDSSKLGDFWARVEETVGAGTNAVIKLLADEVVTAYA